MGRGYVLFIERVAQTHINNLSSSLTTHVRLLLKIINPRIVNTYFFIMSSDQENAASSDDSAVYDFDERDVLENPDPCVAGAIPFPSQKLSEVEEKQVEKQGKARATFMDSFNASHMKLAESCYPDPLFLPEVVDLIDDAARLQAKVKVRDVGVFFCYTCHSSRLLPISKTVSLIALSSWS
jgi:hypothetical protein